MTTLNPRGDHWAEFGPRDQCRSCARPKFGRIWYDVVEQFSFPSLVTDPGKIGVIGKLIHSSSCANFIQVQNAVSPNENPRYKTCGKVVPIFGKISYACRNEFTFPFMNPEPGTNGTSRKRFLCPP